MKISSVVLQGVDVILNSTGGNVIYDKWYKYNQARAIENDCYTLVTMGGDGEKEKVNSYVYGFNHRGKTLVPRLINGNSEQLNIPGGVYLYDLAVDDGEMGCDTSIGQIKTENKKQDFSIPVGAVNTLMEKAISIEKEIWIYPHKEHNIVFCFVDGEEIFRVESFLQLLYSPKLSGYKNKKYVLVCRYEGLTREVYLTRLSSILKVRAMENFCAVLLESNLENNCYQTGRNKTAQMLKPVDGLYWLDISRMSGPEDIWKDKGAYTKASWRKNFIWLIHECAQISNHD